MKISHLAVIVTAGLLLVCTALSAQEAKKAAPAGHAAGGGVQILKMVLCQDVKDREPQQELTTAKVGDVVVGWTKIQATEGTKVTHRWTREGKTVSDIPLEIKGSGRTWSKKTIRDPGNWKWQVLDSDGNVLKEISFTASS
jgi:Protein of unknown function (DUF2914)